MSGKLFVCVRGEGVGPTVYEESLFSRAAPCVELWSCV